jgi:hypothetical protein
LVNPEKSLAATIRSEGCDEQTFRYAPLSSGLDIVRKTLGRHEIATIQTTSVDQTAGTINLTTVLAHASGEWIASDWPVCTVRETAHRTGAALTYARRYALFTLVGIAGEDDLDAPDLATPMTQTSKPRTFKEHKIRRLNGGQQNPIRRTPRYAGGMGPNSSPLGSEGSAELRDRLIAELKELGSDDDAAMWAHRSLRNKNRLTAADAQRVEDAFQTRLSSLSRGDTEPQQSREGQSQTPHTRKPRQPKNAARSKTVDKSALALPELRRIRDRDHVKAVAQQPCLICGRQPADAHHLRFAQNRALGRKVSDEFAVPLCRGHHRELHHCGDEPAWWNKMGIDPIITARALWLETHPLPTGSEKTPGAAAAVTVAAEDRDRPFGKQGPNFKTKPIATELPE